MEPPIPADLPPIPADMDRERLDAMSRKIIGAAQKVSTKLGCGFLEKVYENALCVELARSAVPVEQQRSVLVEYEGTVVGEYIPDLVVDNEIIVELKVSDFLTRVDRAQCINYLRATGYRVCLLLNFGQRRLEVRRLVHRF
ncbi:GxxExxY protein [Usitatibacter rugosus]|uniref:GxxExxY protein n=1 Tax=Usitatibacter rugosus TaxID=2732067 RepID=UPI001BB0EF5E|nr:GxxExxY protein [Usitatibacter rugosus]